MFGLIVAIPVACLAIGICLVAKKTRIEAGKLLISFAVLALMAIFGFLAAALMRVFKRGRGLLYSGAGDFFSAKRRFDTVFAVERQKKKVRDRRGRLRGSIMRGGDRGVYLHRAYIENIPTLEEGGDLLARYAPYAENSETAAIGRRIRA